MYVKIAKHLAPHMAKGLKKVVKHAKRKRKSHNIKSKKRKENLGQKFSFGSKSGKTGHAANNYVTKQEGGGAAKSTRTLNIEALIGIPKRTNDTHERYREKDDVHISGVHLDMMLRNNLSTPLMCNIAVIYNKTCQTSPGVEGFFRNLTNSADSKEVSFSTALTSMDFHHLPINTDRYHVVFHKRYKLIEDTAGGGVYNTQSRKNWMEFRRYIKINRTLKFKDASALEPLDGQLYLVYWFDQPFQPGATAAVTNAATVAQVHKVYFRNDI